MKTYRVTFFNSFMQFTEELFCAVDLIAVERFKSCLLSSGQACVVWSSEVVV